MPGISLVCSQNPLSVDTLARSSDELKYKAGFEVDSIVAGDNIAIAFSGDRNYPCQSYEDDDLLFLVEGLIYNRSDNEIESYLCAIAHDFLNERDHKKRIGEFMAGSDGEYMVMLCLKNSGDILIFNDRWARLPSFYSVIDGTFVFSREIKYILHWLPNIQFDRNWMAEFLVFEYNLGDKCLVKGIKSMKPAMLLHLGWAGYKIAVISDILHPTDFEQAAGGSSREALIERCVDLFRESLVSRVERIEGQGYSIVADLSGGHDSRAVFVGLCNLEADFIVCNDHLISGEEAEIAKHVARLYVKKLQHFDTVHPLDDEEKLREVIYRTDCLVNARIATTCYYDDLEREKHLPARFAHFMGLGGEFLRHRYKPMKHYGNLAMAVIDDGFSNVFLISNACSVLGLSKADFSEKLRSEVEKFPESDMAGKTVHLNFERYNKFDNSGENRHRLFGWVVSPFWGKELFEFVIRHIPLKKIDYLFFSDFLRTLDPKSMQVPIFGGVMGINPARKSLSFVAKIKLKNILRANRYLYKPARRMALRSQRPRSDDEEFLRISGDILRISTDSKLVASYLDTEYIKKLLEKRPTKPQLYQLLTLIYYIDEVGTRFGEKILINR